MIFSSSLLSEIPLIIILLSSFLKETHLYSSKIKLVGEKAMSSYAIVDNMSRGIVNSRISAFKRAVELIYSKYYPKLLILLQYASKEKLETLEEFNRFLEITDVDILGYYTKLKLAMLYTITGNAEV